MAEEAAVWAGDESMADVNLVVQYRVRDPVAALFVVGPTLSDGGDKWDALVRNAAEAALRAEASGRTSEEILAAGRHEIEQAVLRRVAETLQHQGAGFAVEAVCLGDVHPPLEVVPAFREVASALEEKEARINEAEAYRYETETLARGQGRQRVVGAEAAGADRTARAEGSAERFTATAAAYRLAPELTGLRLYLSTVEELLAGRRKIILDRAPPGARRLLWLDRKGLRNMTSGLPAAMPAEPATPAPAVAPAQTAPAAQAAPPTTQTQGAPTP